MTAPTIHTPSRTDDELRADFWTRRALFAAHNGNVMLAAALFKREKEYRQKAVKAPEPGGLAGPGASLPASDAKGFDPAIGEILT